MSRICLQIYLDHRRRYDTRIKRGKTNKQSKLFPAILLLLLRPLTMWRVMESYQMKCGSGWEAYVGCLSVNTVETQRLKTRCNENPSIDSSQRMGFPSEAEEKGGGVPGFQNPGNTRFRRGASADHLVVNQSQNISFPQTDAAPAHLPNNPLFSCVWLILGKSGERRATVGTHDDPESKAKGGDSVAQSSSRRVLREICREGGGEWWELEVLPRVLNE